MATVVPPACLDEASRMNAEKLFGVPAQTFAGIEAALDWTGAQVVGRGLRVDLDAARATWRRLMIE